MKQHDVTSLDFPYLYMIISLCCLHSLPLFLSFYIRRWITHSQQSQPSQLCPSSIFPSLGTYFIQFSTISVYLKYLLSPLCLSPPSKNMYHFTALKNLAILHLPSHRLSPIPANFLNSRPYELLTPITFCSLLNLKSTLFIHFHSLPITLDTKSRDLFPHVLILKLNQYPSSNSLFHLVFMILSSFNFSSQSRPYLIILMTHNSGYMCFSGVAYMPFSNHSDNFQIYHLEPNFSPQLLYPLPENETLSCKSTKIVIDLALLPVPLASISVTILRLSSLLPLNPFLIFLTWKPV